MQGTIRRETHAPHSRVPVLITLRSSAARTLAVAFSSGHARAAPALQSAGYRLDEVTYLIGVHFHVLAVV